VVKQHYQKEGVDFLINFVANAGDGLRELERLQGVLEVMINSGRGLVLNVVAHEGVTKDERSL